MKWLRRKTKLSKDELFRALIKELVPGLNGGHGSFFERLDTIELLDQITLTTGYDTDDDPDEDPYYIVALKTKTRFPSRFPVSPTSGRAKH